MGETGVGFLNAVIGLGGLVGAVVAIGLGGSGTRLTKAFALALVGWGLPLVLIGVWPTAAFALVALFVTGVSNAALDVSGFTLIQRGVRNEDRVTVFSLMESLFGVGLLAGSLVAPALVALVGPRGGLLVAGAILPILALVTSRSIARNTRESVLTEHLALLRRNPLFAPLPLTALDQLAESLQSVTFDPGEVVMQKGEPGDSYLLISEGIVDVSDDGRELRSCERGDGVGEIALLRTVPRTATVTAQTHVEGYQIDAATFLSAVAGPAAAAAAEAVASLRLEHSKANASDGTA